MTVAQLASVPEYYCESLPPQTAVKMSSLTVFTVSAPLLKHDDGLCVTISIGYLKHPHCLDSQQINVLFRVNISMTFSLAEQFSFLEVNKITTFCKIIS